MARENPDAVSGTSNQYQNWEVADPEKWVPDGYALVRVDSRGAGRSPGYLDHNNARENRDFTTASSGRRRSRGAAARWGSNGISYYAASQWRAAALQPPHLAAICVWEGWVGLLPRVGAARRHRLQLPQELAGNAGDDRAARARRARAEERA